MSRTNKAQKTDAELTRVAVDLSPDQTEQLRQIQLELVRRRIGVQYCTQTEALRAAVQLAWDTLCGPQPRKGA